MSESFGMGVLHDLLGCLREPEGGVGGDSGDEGGEEGERGEDGGEMYGKKAGMVVVDDDVVKSE